MRNVSFSLVSTLALSFAASLSIGCGDNNGNGNGDDDGTVDASDGDSVDAVPNNPPNPKGLGPAPVDLGTATDLAAPGPYVMIAKTAITNVTGSSITGGHVALSPAAASFITGFDLMPPPPTVESTSSVVVAPGKVYAANYTTPTATNLTTAVLAMQAAYTDAASRTNPDFLDLASGEIGGETLAPGLYRWGTGVTIPDDVTLAGGADDVWIFQISNDLDLSTATEVLLSGGAQARNIYWQVAGQVTIHANAHFEGIILAKTQITLQTTATMDGRLYAQSMIALDNNAITAP